MSYPKIPHELKYTNSHEWVKQDLQGNYVIGITDHAQSLLGDLVFVELPEVGSSFDKGNEIGVVESVKAASDVYTPISGEVVAVNEALQAQPDLINKDPYGAGWLYKIAASAKNEVDGLLDSHEYAKSLED